MHRITLLGCLTVLLLPGLLWAQGAFPVRGTLPWHNFLSGPTAWDEADYEGYLDEMKAQGLNYLVLHCYTGGAERYAPYVEPIIRMQYRNVVPQAEFDTSLTARWGYRPLAVREFAFGTAALFNLPAGAEAFGSSAATLAKDNEDRYRRAQGLIRRVIAMAHARGIRVAIGFEFGIWPLEFMSIVPPGTYLPAAMLPDPTTAASHEIQRATIDNILQAYPGVDGIWLWLHEHTMKVPAAAATGPFQALMERDRKYFPDCDEASLFTGVWSLEFIRQANDCLRERAPNVQLVISGWGGGNQLPPVLLGLDKVLPPTIIFSCLNPGGGGWAHPPAMARIAKHRKVWAIPWLEFDGHLWHPQPNVGRLRQQVLQARQDNLDGVFGIHWRTRDVRANLHAFARFAQTPTKDAESAEAFYKRECATDYGSVYGPKLAAVMTDLDAKNVLLASSPEYFPYDPGWGRLQPEARSKAQTLLDELRDLAKQPADAGAQANLDALIAEVEFVLLLDEVGRQIEPAYRLKNQWLLGGVPAGELSAQRDRARQSLEAAPIEKLFKAYARRVRSRGELGVLSSLNQRLWLQYRELAEFLRRQSESK